MKPADDDNYWTALLNSLMFESKCEKFESMSLMKAFSWYKASGEFCEKELDVAGVMEHSME